MKLVIFIVTFLQRKLPLSSTHHIYNFIDVYMLTYRTITINGTQFFINIIFTQPCFYVLYV